MKKIRHTKILNALLRDCKQSDRNIAKIAKVSQPTVTRARNSLQAEGIIKNYFAIPDYAKLGFKFGAITICELRPETSPKGLSENSVISAPTISADSNFMLITVHKSIEDYDAFLSKIKAVAVDGTLNITLFATQDLEIKPVQVPEKGT